MESQLKTVVRLDPKGTADAVGWLEALGMDVSTIQAPQDAVIDDGIVTLTVFVLGADGDRAAGPTGGPVTHFVNVSLTADPFDYGLTEGEFMIPSVGRIVHYVSMGSPPDPVTGEQKYPSVCRMAGITEVPDKQWGGQSFNEPEPVTIIGLCVLNPTGQFFDRGVPYSADNAPGTWHWPERV
jgi:hypothetical protein